MSLLRRRLVSTACSAAAVRQQRALTSQASGVDEKALKHFVQDWEARGCLSETTSFSLGKILHSEMAAQPGKPVCVYAGFDPTGPSLHLGHLSVVLSLVRLQKLGVKPIAVVGGATALIGDPTGKSADRPLLTEEQVEKNVQGIRQSLGMLLDFDSGSADGSGGAVCLNNADFYSSMTVIQYLRDVGRHFRLSYMLAKDSVKSRLGSNSSEEGEAAGASPSGGMSFTEFTYQTFQAHDFCQLYSKHHCKAQIGGSDQWGNITAGIELIRRSLGQEAHGVTTPLVTTAGGKKFGKSEGNALWLDPALTSHYALYQYLYNTADNDVGQLLRLLTLLPLEECVEITGKHIMRPNQRYGQRVLAEEVTKLVRGPEGLKSACTSSRLLFGAARPAKPEGAAAADSGSAASASAASEEAAPVLDESSLQVLLESGDVPKLLLPREQLVGALAIDLAVKAGAAPSKAEARRTLSAGGLYLNYAKLTDAKHRLTESDLVSGKAAILGSGKKKMWLLAVEEP